MTDVELVWGTDCSVTESTTWHAASRSVLFADLDGGRILSYNIDDESRREWQMPTNVGSFGICDSGRLIVAARQKLWFLDLDSGDVEEFTGGIPEPEVNRFNDGRPGPDGAYWVGTRDGRRDLPGQSNEPLTDPTGGLYRITPDGKIEQKASGILTGNGMTFSPDGRILYMADSSSNYVDAWDLEVASGQLSNRRRFLDVPISEGRPDGAAMDTDGCYWAGGVTAGCINQFSPEGKLVRSIPMPCAAPTMPCFADEWMFVTSLKGIHKEATADFTQLPHNIAGLFRLPAPAVGVPVATFADR